MYECAPAHHQHDLALISKISIACLPSNNQGLPAAAHHRPPVFHDHGNPIPDAERGCYAFNRYHSNDHGHGEGFWGSLRESYAAEDAFEARNRGILEVAGLGETGKGDWDNLGRSGLLLDVDPQYLLAFGFTQVILLQLIATREAHLSNSRLFACLVFYNNPYTLLRTHAHSSAASPSPWSTG